MKKNLTLIKMASVKSSSWMQSLSPVAAFKGMKIENQILLIKSAAIAGLLGGVSVAATRAYKKRSPTARKRNSTAVKKRSSVPKPKA